KSTPAEMVDKVRAVLAELTWERKRLASLEKELSRSMVDALLAKAEDVNGVTVVTAKIPFSSASGLREMGDLLRERLKSAVIVLGTVHDGKPSFVAMVTSDLVGKGLHAGDIVRQVAAVTGGGGGGKATMAQAGGKDKSKLDEALRLVKHTVQKIR
ncbi:MAG TPA: alanine--tRNA ligase, partial [Dehalococcoidia bacterium]|nr:alanine--tRNA ligase [Dehalococcoidia bacterium]